jgi:hypothetical protein
MANLTLTEARTAKDIIDKDETIDRQIAAVKTQATNVMALMRAFHAQLPDQESKALIAAKLAAFRTDLDTITTV